MNKIRITNPNNSNDYFDIPWEWIEKGTYAPNLNDLEASAERGKLTGTLSRVRCAEVPSATLPIKKKLTQKELYPLLKLLRLVKIKITYFEKYLNSYVTKEFYAQKPNPTIYKVPKDNDIDKIVYNEFTIEFAGYGDISR